MLYKIATIIILCIKNKPMYKNVKWLNSFSKAKMKVLLSKISDLMQRKQRDEKN
jgi:ribosomal protein S18